jgi:hypothetical protein
MALTTSKIAPGYYKGTCQGYSFYVNTTQLERTFWVWFIEREEGLEDFGGNELYFTKKEALEALESWVTNWAAEMIGQPVVR